MININQKKAIEMIKGPVLVLAGPGSGKTFVLTNRIINMVYKCNINPENILVISFTHKATTEMKERYEMLKANVGNDNIKQIPKFGTFHSIFYEILRENFGYNNESLLTEIEKERIIVEIIEKIKDIKVDENSVKNIIKDIEREKICIEKEEKYTPTYLSKKLFNIVKNEYQEKLFNMKKLDFHDMIDVCFKMLKEHKDILSYYQEKYKYILIDEFQDINKSQYNIIKLLCKSKNIFVVGDDDQSIYKFRGSKPSIIHDFKRDYPIHKTITLSQNYRCAKTIVRFSKKVIDRNKKRVKKDLVSERNENGKIIIKSFLDAKNENLYLINNIKEKIKQGINYKDIAVLYRTNIIVKPLIETLEQYNIPFEVKDYNSSFYDNIAIKDIISYLRIINGDKDSAIFMNIINKPLRYISRNAIGYKTCDIDSIINYYKDKDFVLKNVLKLKSDIGKAKNMHPTLAIRYIRENIGYDKYLYNMCIEKNMDVEELFSMIDELEEEAIKSHTINEFLSYINKQKNKEKYVGNFDENRNAVRLMTFHSSKGLEFNDVTIIDCNEGLIPHKKSLLASDIETERRLFYVACTRAKNSLNIYFTKNRYGKSYNPSRFIMEGLGKNYG